MKYDHYLQQIRDAEAQEKRAFERGDANGANKARKTADQLKNRAACVTGRGYFEVDQDARGRR